MNTSTGTNIGANLILAAFGTAVLAPVQYELNVTDIPADTATYQQLTSNSWDDAISLSNNPSESKINSLKTFSENLIKNTTDIDPEILEVINKNYWDLL